MKKNLFTTAIEVFLRKNHEKCSPSHYANFSTSNPLANYKTFEIHLIVSINAHRWIKMNFQVCTKCNCFIHIQTNKVSKPPGVDRIMQFNNFVNTGCRLQVHTKENVLKHARFSQTKISKFMQYTTALRMHLWQRWKRASKTGHLSLFNLPFLQI